MLHLASRSPRRRELLARLGVEFHVLDTDVPEVRAPGEPAAAYVRRVARDKARAGLALAGAGALVLGSDTEVVLDDEVFGKPADADGARAMLRRLSGRTHEVLTAVCLASAEGEREVLVATTVEFAALGDDDLDDYVASGEPMGRAGAYAIQGGAERFVRRLAGSYSGVMGLPLHETAALLAAAGLRPRTAAVAG
jgi:septum formation protein